MNKTGIKHRQIEKRAVKPISAEARKLIQTMLRRCKGSERRASRLLRLNNHAQLGRMLRGEMAETPAMHAAVLRAKARARRAFYLEPMAVQPVELEQVRKMVKEAHWVIEVLAKIVG